jgi:hypothetical protein
MYSAMIPGAYDGPDGDSSANSKTLARPARAGDSQRAIRSSSSLSLADRTIRYFLCLKPPPSLMMGLALAQVGKNIVNQEHFLVQFFPIDKIHLGAVVSPK